MQPTNMLRSKTPRACLQSRGTHVAPTPLPITPPLHTERVQLQYTGSRHQLAYMSGMAEPLPTPHTRILLSV